MRSACPARATSSRLPIGAVILSAVPCSARSGTASRSGRAQIRATPSVALRELRAGPSGASISGSRAMSAITAGLVEKSRCFTFSSGAFGAIAAVNRSAPAPNAGMSNAMPGADSTTPATAGCRSIA